MSMDMGANGSAHDGGEGEDEVVKGNHGRAGEWTMASVPAPARFRTRSGRHNPPMDPFVPTDIHGLPALRLVSTRRGATALVAHHAPHVFRGRPGRRRRAALPVGASVYAQGTPIRAALPVISRSSARRTAAAPRLRTHHGLTLDDTRAGCGVHPRDLAPDSDATTLASWPHAFHAELTVASAAHSSMSSSRSTHRHGILHVHDGGLHTYLARERNRERKSHGLGGCSYRDQLAQGGQAHGIT